MLNRKKTNFLERVQDSNRMMKSTPFKYRFLNDPFSKLGFSEKKNIRLSPAIPPKKLIRYEFNFLKDSVQHLPSKNLSEDKLRGLYTKKQVYNPPNFLKKQSSEPFIDAKRRVSFNFIHSYPKQILGLKDTSVARKSTPSFRDEISINEVSFGRKDLSLFV